MSEDRKPKSSAGIVRGEELAACSCAEVYGEDPRCARHGFATAWRLSNTTPEEWQQIAVEGIDTIDMLDTKITALRARQPQQVKD